MNLSREQPRRGWFLVYMCKLIDIDFIHHTGQEAYAVKKNWAWKETKSIFKLMYQVTKIHWETNILIVSFLEIDRLVFFPM